MAKVPAKTDQGTDVVDPITGEVLPSSVLDWMEDHSGNTQDFRQEDLIIPRINILQDLSPQVKERDPGYIPGAKPGLIINSVTSSLDTTIEFCPARYTVRYVAWQPRPHGGLVDQDIDPKRLGVEFEPDGIGRWSGQMEVREGEKRKQVSVEIIETPEWAGIVRSGDGKLMPAVISFPSTKSKVARKINTQIASAELPRKDRLGTFTPPAYGHLFVLGTGLENAGDNEWYGWSIKRAGWVADETMAKKAEKLYRDMNEGAVKAAAMDAGDAA